MRQQMKVRKILLLCLVLSLVVILSGCGKQKVTTANQHNKQEQSDSSSSRPTLSLEFVHGEYQQAAGLISVPIVFENTGSNRTLIDSNNFTLIVNGKKYHPYQENNEASDFHIDFSNNNVYQNTVTFNIKKRLTKSELKKVKLTYLTDKGNEVTAKKISKNVLLQDIRENVSGYNPTDIGTYYKQSISYLENAAEQKKKDPNAKITSIEDRFNDKKYDQFHVWVAVPSTGNVGSKVVVFKVLNDSNTDFNVSYGDLELVDKNGNEIQVAPSYRNFNIQFPHGKYTTVVVPMEATLKSRKQPYQVEVRADSSGNNPTGSFFNTKRSFNPAEVKFSNEITSDSLFSLSPVQYPKDKIVWSDQKVDTASNTITAEVQLMDYFNLKNDNYQLIGFNDDGQREIEGVKAKPAYVATTDKTKITWKAKNLNSVMAYQHVQLQNYGKTVLNLK